MKLVRELLFLAFKICCIECLVYESKHFELYRPVVIGETVLIDCSTDVKNISLQLFKRDRSASTDTILKPDGSLLILKDQKYTILISSEKDGGEYICNAQANGLQVEKSLIISIAGKVPGDIPKPIVSSPYNSVQEGRKLTITCQTKGTFAKLSWIKETVKVASDKVTDKPPEFLEGTVIVESVLVIDDIKLDDVGTYTCRSTSRFNKSNIAEATAMVAVRGQKLYWIVNNPLVFNSVTTRTGSSVVISCAMSHPAKKVKFYRAISGSPLTEIQIKGGKYQLINDQELVIRKVTLLDYGTYICKAENNVLKDKRIQLFINNFAVAEPSVFVKPKFLNLDFNAAANITCSTYGNNAKVEWLVNVNIGGQLRLVPVPSENIFGSSSITPQGNVEKVWTLIFKNVTEKDAANYVCKVSVDGKPAFSEADVAVKPPLSPQIKKFSSQVTNEDQGTYLNCRSRGAPKPIVKFFKNDIEITRDTPGYRIDDRKLYIDQPKYPNHDGVYTCSVSNMFGKAMGKAKLTVTVAPIIDKSKDIVVVGGKEDLEITCKIKRSNPIPKITWKFQPWSCPPSKGYNCAPDDGKWKRADPRNYEIKPKNTDITMTSTFKVPKSSVTKYFIRCTAEHKYGKDSRDVIGIIDKRDASNLLQVKPRKVVTDEEESFSLKCTGEAGLFLNLTWQVNGTKPVQADNKTISIKKSGSVLQTQVSVLTIKNVTPSHSGLYQCIAIPARTQDKIVKVASSVTINKIYQPKVLSLTSPQVQDGEKAVISCEVDAHPSAQITWYKDGEVLRDIGQLVSINDCEKTEQGKYFQLTDNLSKKLGTKTYQLIICKSTWKINDGTFSCLATNALGKIQQDTMLRIFASPMMVFSQTDEYTEPEHDYSRNCTSEGNPSPFTWWEKETNGVYKPVTKNSTNGFSYLNFTRVAEHHYGTYRCVSSNTFGVTYDTMTLRRPLIAASSTEPGARASLIAALIVAIFIIIIISILVVILYKRRQLYGGFYIFSIPPSPDYFRKLDPTKSIAEQTNKLPYFPEWEFPRNKIRLKNQVGAGAFGEVYIADAIGISKFDPRYKISMKHKALVSKKRFSFSNFQRRPRSGTTATLITRADSTVSTKSNRSTKSTYSKYDKSQAAVVAIKKLKEDATQVEYKDLISELKILIHIGQQDNIVNLLGACTKGTEKDTMVILEFCPFGNLLSFVKERRQMFKPIWSKQHVGMEKEFTTFDLCVAAYQIAKGLDYLACRKCVHRDVAARNVLVGENFVMKIADFGLARDVYEDERYVKVSGGLLPIKWMAVEAIMDRVFTHQTDVWSFGILLWELMTLGGSPYPGVHVKDLIEYLTAGNRMKQPQFCPNEIYKLMRECWSEIPSQRPLFSDIVLRLARVIEGHCNASEINTYLDKCHISGGSFSFYEDDYLRPVDGEIGSFQYTPPPPYSQSVNNHKKEQKNESMFKRKPSERYVPDNRIIEESFPPADEKFDNYEQAIDSCGSSDKSLEPKAKLDEYVCEKGNTDNVCINVENDIMNNNAETEPLYMNGENTDHRANKENRSYDIDQDKDIDENNPLLNHRSPSPVEQLSSYINEEYNKIAHDTYKNV